ncbi:hypothetical protein QBC46DRAFT_411815 [Diplogelasinospora grovesii]|uniref:Uncharacterized protein n=1 Tax=Diplogelasinospora grovesii TaxID=303347 RepID=A0AAN6N043_9PEZI|nr:hypothetical protein QBC46DRAFT_411815 [Diplogelasinospora grovesii]
MSGAGEAVLQRARGGRCEIELHSAVWTNTLQTFIQQPVSQPASTTQGCVERADEARLLVLFLASDDYIGSQNQKYFPMSPWKPFGHTALEDLNLERGFNWDTHPAETSAQADPDLIQTYSLLHRQKEEMVHVPYDKFDPEDDAASSHATADAFRWLRRGGFPASEQPIRHHEWAAWYFDEEEEEGCESLWTSDEEERIQKKSDQVK